MAKKIFVLLPILYLFIAGGIAQQKDYSLKLTEPVVRKSGSEYTISVSADYSGPDLAIFRGNQVTLPVAPLHIEGQTLNGRLEEQNLLYAGIAYDLNGNGSTVDLFTIVYRDQRLFLENRPVKTASLGKKIGSLFLYNYGTDTDPAIFLFNKNPILIDTYYPSDRRTALLLGIDGRVLSVKSFISPAVIISIIRQADSYREKSTVVFSGQESFVTATNKAYFPDQAGGWVISSWTVVPMQLDNRGKGSVSVTVSGITTPFVVEAVGVISPGDGIAMKSHPMIRPVKE